MAREEFGRGRHQETYVNIGGLAPTFSAEGQARDRLRAHRFRQNCVLRYTDTLEAR